MLETSDHTCSFDWPSKSHKQTASQLQQPQAEGKTFFTTVLGEVQEMKPILHQGKMLQQYRAAVHNTRHTVCLPLAEGTVTY